MTFKTVHLAVPGVLALMLASPMVAQIHNAGVGLPAAPQETPNDNTAQRAGAGQGMSGADAHRFSRLERIDQNNVSALVPAWAYALGSHRQHAPQGPPQLRGGVIYVADSANRLHAIDPRSGTRLRQPEKSVPCCEDNGAPVLVPFEMIRDGSVVKAAAATDQHGLFYVIDRTSGTVISANPLPKEAASMTGTLPITYSRRTGLFYVPSNPQEHAGGALKALDPVTGRLAWEHRSAAPLRGGVLATAGGLVFAGTPEGALVAFDDSTGKVLWRFETGAAIVGSPITWEQDGVQMIAVVSGGGGGLAGTTPGLHQGGMLWTFSLPRRLAAR